MAIRIDIWVPYFTGVRHVTQYTLTAGSLHDIITDQLPNLTSQVEQNLAEFETGDIVLSARNDDGWWDSTAFTSAALDPTARFPLCLYVDVFVAGSLVFQGDVDIKTISFDRKLKTVSFTCLGPLRRLEQWSAETVRRTVPTFSDFGLATSCGTAGSNWYLKDTTKIWYPKDIVNCCLIDANNTVWTIIGTYGMGTGFGRDGLTINNPIRTPPNWGGTPTTPPPVASYTIRPMVFATRYDWQSGGTITSDPGYLNDASKTWTVNQWVGFYVFDSQAIAFGPITSNTSVQLNFATGTPDVSTGIYNIRKANYPNLLESLGPTIDKLYIAGQTLTDQGDLLNLTAANGPIIREPIGWAPQGTYVAATQEATVQFVGAKASDPALSDHQIWLANAIEQDLHPTDGVIMVTPYFRDKTVAQLAVLLFAACGSAVQATAINVPAFADDVVRYADFGGKSVADALTELAMISNCSLFCTFSGTTTEGDAPKVTFHFQRRDAGLGTALDLSVQHRILERRDSPAWEQYYPSIVVQGANGTQVQKGSARPGGSQLQVQSDYMHTYAWEHQVLERLYDFYGRRRDLAVVTAKAEAIPAASAGVAAATDDFEADTVGDPPPTSDWVSWLYSSVFTVQEPGLGDNDSHVLRNISGATPSGFRWVDAGEPQNIDLRFDWWVDDDVLARSYFVFRFDGWTTPTTCLVLDAPSGPGQAGAFLWRVEDFPGGTWTLLAADWTVAMPIDYWVTVRILARDDLVAIKYWPTTLPEPGEWNLTAVGVPLATAVSTGFALYLTATATGVYIYFDNFYKVGSPGSAGCDLLSKVSLNGTDEWWVIRLARQLRQPALTVDLTLISATGVEYPPDDFATVDASAIPEPPVVTGVTPSGNNRNVALSWPFVEEQPLLGFQRTVWRSIDARPESPTLFVAIGGPLTVVAGSPPTFNDFVVAGFLFSPGPWYVDYQAVLIDGRTSQPCPAYLFS